MSREISLAPTLEITMSRLRHRYEADDCPYQVAFVWQGSPEVTSLYQILRAEFEPGQLDPFGVFCRSIASRASSLDPLGHEYIAQATVFENRLVATHVSASRPSRARRANWSLSTTMARRSLSIAVVVSWAR